MLPILHPARPHPAASAPSSQDGRRGRGHLLAILALLATSLAAQGVGTVTSRGAEPQLVFSDHEVGTSSRLVMEALPPSSRPTAILAVGAFPTAIDLGPSGIPGAVLGVEPSAPAGLFLTSPWLPVGPAGRILLDFVPDPALLGERLYAQCAVLDPAVPGGAAFSDSISIAFGPDPDVRVGFEPRAGGEFLLRELFGDGATLAPPAPTEGPFRPLPVGLAARADARAPAEALPVVRETPGFGPHVAFPSGAKLFRVLEPGDFEAWRFIAPDGRRVSRDWPRAFRRRGREAFSPLVATSPFDPVGALLADEAVSGFPGVTVFLFRTDGSNWPGTPHPVLPVVFTGALAGFEPDEESPTFLEDHLLLVDGDNAIVVRVPLADPSLAARVTLPLVGGRPVTETDQEFAWSADGRLAALTAGQGEFRRDLLLVAATGPATNLTNAPGELQEVGYGDLADGQRLALSADGARVAYVKTLGGSREILVQETAPARPFEQITTNARFVSTIDVLIGIHFAASGVLSFQAGQFPNAADVYAATGLATAPSVANLTATSGVLTPPFDVGASVLGRRLLPFADGGVATLVADATGATERLAIVDAQGGQGAVAGLLAGSLRADRVDGRDVALYTTVSGSFLAGLDGVATAAPLHSAPAGTRFDDLLDDGAATWLVTTDASGADLRRLGAAAATLGAPVGVGLAGIDQIEALSGNRLLIAGRDAGGGRRYRVLDRATGTLSVAHPTPVVLP